MPQPNELLCIVNGTLPPTTYDTNLNTQLRYPINFEYVNQNDIVVFSKTGLITTVLNNLLYNTSGQYIIDESSTPSEVVFTNAPGGDELIIARYTDICNMLVVFEAGASIRAEDLNAACLQLLNLIQENYQLIKEIQAQVGTLLTTPLYQSVADGYPEDQDESDWTNTRIPSGAAALMQLNAANQVDALDAADYYDGKLWYRPSNTTQASSVSNPPVYVAGSSTGLSPAWPASNTLSAPTAIYDFDENVSGSGTNLRLSVSCVNSELNILSIVNGGENWEVGDTAETTIAVSNQANTNVGSIRVRVTVNDVSPGLSQFFIKEGGTASPTWTTISSNDPSSNPFTPKQTFYVNTQGTDTNSGLTPGTAFRTIKKAVYECNKLKGVATTLTFATSGPNIPQYNNTNTLANGIGPGRIKYTIIDPTTSTPTPHGLDNGDIVTIPQSTWSCSQGNSNYPDTGPTKFSVFVDSVDTSVFYIDVGPSGFVHTFVSTVSSLPGFNNEIPVRQSRVGDNFQIQVAPGSYAEMTPIVIYAKNLCITGSSLRNTYIHPSITNGVQPDGTAYTVTKKGDVTDDKGNTIEIFDSECRTMFYCDSGTYLNNLTVCGMKAYFTRDGDGAVIRGGGTSIDPDTTYGLPPNSISPAGNQGWIAQLRPSDATLINTGSNPFNFVAGNVPNTSAYTKQEPGSFISKSPYIQNCTNFSDINIDNGPGFNPQFLTGEGGDTSSGPTGGGILCDGDSPTPTSPLRSFVVDAFTQIALNGPGILCTNNGYSQLVSFFGTFCWYHAKSLNGAQLNLSNCTTDFGQWGLIADGKSPTHIFEGRISQVVNKGQEPDNVAIKEITGATYQNGAPTPPATEPVNGTITMTVANHGGVTGDLVEISGLVFNRVGYPQVKVPGDTVSKYVMNRIDDDTLSIVWLADQGNLTYDTTDLGTIQVPTTGSDGAVPQTQIVIDNLTVNPLASWEAPRRPNPGVTQVVEVGDSNGTPVLYPILGAQETSPGTWVLDVYNPVSSFNRTNLGVAPVSHYGEGATNPIPANTVANPKPVKFYIQSYISTGGHTFEFVGSGCDYDSHPDLGGRSIPANQVKELGGDATVPNLVNFNCGRVWQSSTDETGTFQVGQTFKVDQKTGLITLDPSVIVTPKFAVTEDIDLVGWSIVNSSAANQSNNPPFSGRIKIQPLNEAPVILGPDAVEGVDGPNRSGGSAPILEPIKEMLVSDSSVWNAVTDYDIGYDPNEVPLSQMLGRVAFQDNVSEIGFQTFNPNNVDNLRFNVEGTGNDLMVYANDDGTIREYSFFPPGFTFSYSDPDLTITAPDGKTATISFTTPTP